MLFFKVFFLKKKKYSLKLNIILYNTIFCNKFNDIKKTNKNIL